VGGTGYRVLCSLGAALVILTAPAPAVGSPALSGRPIARPLAYHASTNAGEKDCQAPNQWWPKDQTGQTADAGFRAWVCASSVDAAASDQDRVLSLASGLWTAMTVAEPNGMGLPVPDTAVDNGDGGKIDIYVLGATRCITRDGACQGIDESSEVAAAVPTGPFGVAGRPHASSGFLLLSKGRLASKSIIADLAHEFFHVLQFAHNAPEFPHWYVEASATWAEWEYVRSSTIKETFDFYRHEFQTNNRSLLTFDDIERVPDAHQYGAWVWPLFQEMHAGMGAPSVFTTWQALEPATTREQFDSIIDESLPAKSFFRDFAVTNLQPKPYNPTSSSGLEAETWQRLTARKDFPRDEHLVSRTVGLKQGKSSEATDTYSAKAAALAAQYDQFTVSDGKIHQITIDIGSLQNVGNADLDVVGRLATGGGKKWVRLTPTSHEVTLCLDEPTDDVNLFYVVISNHEVARKDEGADPAEMVKGAYEVTTKRSCDLVPTTFSGTATAERVSQWIIDDELLGVTTTTIEMSGTFTFDQKVFDEGGGLFTYDFDGSVTYRMSGYDAFCEDMHIDPTLVPGHGDILVFPKGKNLEYTLSGQIVPTYGDTGGIIAPELEFVETCDGETNTLTTGVDTWPWLMEFHHGYRVSDGMELKDSWVYEDYEGDPDDEMTFTWDFVGECPCPPEGTN
jgi:hypothetical protein